MFISEVLSGVERRRQRLCLLSLPVLLVAALLAPAAVAQQPNTPMYSGAQESDPVELPQDDGKPAARPAVAGWSYIYIHNNSGQDEDEENDKEYDSGEEVDFLKFKVKDPEKDEPARRKKEQHRIKISEVKKRNAQGEWEDITKDVDPEEASDSVTVELESNLKHCETVRVRIKVEVRTRKRFTDNWGDWGADEDKNVELNINGLDGARNEVTMTGAGDSPFGRGSGWATVADAFADLSPSASFSAAFAEAGDPALLDAPDLVFSERNNWYMPTGTLRLFATGGASFDTTSNLQVIARDEQGNDAVAAGEVTFGTPAVVNGVIEVPVTWRDTDADLHIAVMVRGAKVDLPAMANGTIIGYAVGGVPAGNGAVRVPPLVRVGTEPEGAALRASADLEIVDPQDPQDHGLAGGVGGLIYTARPYQSGVHEGFLDAIVLGETQAGVLREGSFEITPLDGRGFVASEDTKLYVIHADDHSDQSEAFDDATIEVTSAGALRVTLAQRSLVETPLKLMILNPKVNMGMGPFQPGDNARFAIGGDALRQGPQRSVVLVEGAVGTEDDHKLLPQDPLVAQVLTEVASVDEE